MGNQTQPCLIYLFNRAFNIKFDIFLDHVKGQLDKNIQSWLS